MHTKRPAITGPLAVASRHRVDPWLLGAVLFLSAWGLVLVYSSSSALGLVREDGNDLFYLQSQLVRCLFGAGLLLALTWLDARVLAGRCRLILWGGVMVLLILLLLPWGPGVEIRGATRWVRFGSISFQPSAFARLAMIPALAGTLSRSAGALNSWRGVLPVAGITVVTSALIAAEPHLSLGLLTALGGFLLIFLAGACVWRLLVAAVGGMGLAGLVAHLTGNGYHLDRLNSFFSDRPGDLAFQSMQSVLTVGSGGLLGRGLGKGMQKYFFLPDPHTDFILSILVEELGFLGLLGLLVLSGFIILRIFTLGGHCSSRFGELLCYGVGLHVLLAVLLHTAVCFGWAPTTGVPYPLVSFGGSALVANLIGLGLVLSVSGRGERALAFRVTDKESVLLLREPTPGRARQ